MTTFRCACCDETFPRDPDAVEAEATDAVVVCDGCHDGITAYLDAGARL